MDVKNLTCINAMLAELKPAEPLDDATRRELDELIRLRAKHGMDDYQTTTKLDHFREIEAQHQRALAERNVRILARQQGQIYWEEKFAILVVLWTAFRLFV